jgi:hypothetical protein
MPARRSASKISKTASPGQLNAREAQRLDNQQDRVANAEARAKADGTVTAQERGRLHRLQDRASGNIRHQKHDRQTARR